MNINRKTVTNEKFSLEVTSADISELYNGYEKLMRQLIEGDIQDEKGISKMMQNPVTYAFIIGKADMLRLIMTEVFGVERSEIDKIESDIRAEYETPETRFVVNND